jgi:hypothetical protein
LANFQIFWTYSLTKKAGISAGLVLLQISKIVEISISIRSARYPAEAVVDTRRDHIEV